VNLHRLRLFCLVVEHQTFTAAADLLMVKQASVHLQVRQLERELGSQLLVRSGRQMIPTEAGEEVYRAARRMLADAEQLQATLSDLRVIRANHLTVGVTSASSYLLVPVLNRFREARPQVKIALMVEHGQSVADAVLKGEVDFGVVVPPVASERLVVRSLCERRYVLVARPDHPLAQRGWADPADLERESLVGGGVTHRRLIERALADVGISSVRVDWEVDRLDTHKQVLLSGGAISFLFEHTIQAELASGLLTEIPLRGVSTSAVLFVLVSRPRRSISALVADAISFVLDEFAVQGRDFRQAASNLEAAPR
jgi:DNA-binding transcriptional LysR family regulator